ACHVMRPAKNKEVCFSTFRISGGFLRAKGGVSASMDRGQGEKATGQKDGAGARAPSPAPLHHSVHAPSTVTYICLKWLVPRAPGARGACGWGLGGAACGAFCEARTGCSPESQGHWGHGGARSPDEPWAGLTEVTLPLPVSTRWPGGKQLCAQALALEAARDSVRVRTSRRS
uniref:Uncharacterized protein n=1 Tax=Crocodylus porosus TaxID=8502 RepID=A0A7M4EVV1_CROPO